MRIPPTGSPAREKLARLLLVPLLLVILSGAVLASWHSSWSVDNRT
jgi:F0F1-type ATP synthase assembly protein I